MRIEVPIDISGAETPEQQAEVVKALKDISDALYYDCNRIIGKIYETAHTPYLRGYETKN